MTTSRFSEPARLSTPRKPIVLTKTAGQQPGSGHCCLRSSYRGSHSPVSSELTLINIDYFMVGECVRFLMTSCEGLRKRTSEFNDPSQRVSNKNRTNEPTMK